MKPIETTGRTVDHAIDAALDELGLTREEVQVDILQIESSGIFGMFGRKDARVRVSPVKGGRTAADEPAPPRRDRERDRDRNRDREAPRPKPTEAPRAERPQRDSGPREKRPQQQPAQESRRKPEQPQRGAVKPPREREAPVRTPRPAPAPRAETRIVDEEVTDPIGERAAEVLRTITASLGLTVEVSVQEDSRAVKLSVSGEDIGQLIGRRGRTLGSVQYLISRILNEDRPSKKKISIDVDGYAESRERSLVEMAERAAEKVIRTNRPFSLRPMGAQDRRVVHVTLQEHPTVATESFGDESERFVMVYPRSMDPEELPKFIGEGDRDRERGEDSRGSRGPRRRQRGRSRGPRRSGGSDRPQPSAS